jgi:nucleoside-diphosphate-sugar epimerase
MDPVKLHGKRVLVTGGNGYLGTFLTQGLLEAGADVWIASIDVEDGERSRVLDITDADETSRIIREIGPLIVFHLAANLDRGRDPSLYPRLKAVNETGTFNILTALDKTGCENFIFTSSSEIYGNNASPFREDMVPKPVSPYSISKAKAEQIIRTWSAQTGKHHIILRLFNFYGPHMPENFFIPQMINTLKRGEDFLMTGGRQKRDFLYIDDVTRAMLMAAVDPSALNETFNICSGEGKQLGELATQIGKLMGSQARIRIGALPYRENEIWEMIGDNRKIAETLGFRPSIMINEGLRRVIDTHGR